jgi:hypothetical protein
MVVVIAAPGGVVLNLLLEVLKRILCVLILATLGTGVAILLLHVPRRLLPYAVGAWGSLR